MYYHSGTKMNLQLCTVFARHFAILGAEINHFRGLLHCTQQMGQMEIEPVMTDESRSTHRDLLGSAGMVNTMILLTCG